MSDKNLYKQLADKIFPYITETIEDLEKRYPERDLKEGARVTRFAPSPTGYLHIGAFYTALVNLLTANASDGVAYLRIEDTDKKREIDDGVSAIINGFNSFGIDFDEGVTGFNEGLGYFAIHKGGKLDKVFGNRFVCKVDNFFVFKNSYTC